MAMSINQKKQSAGYSSLCDAIKNEDKETARQLILNNTPVNPPKKFSFNTPLHWAILKFKDTEMIEMLLEKGANKSAKNQHSQTPLCVAVDLNKQEAIEILLDKGAHIDENFSILINNASKKGNLKIVEILLKHGIQANLPINLNNAVNTAAQNGHVRILQFLLPYYNVQDTQKWILRDVIFKKGVRYEKCLQLLFQHGYKINPEIKNDFSLICTAVQNGYIAIVNEFLKLGIDIDRFNKKTGLTLLHLACINRNADIAKLLIENKANMNLEVRHVETEPNETQAVRENQVIPGRTALYIAVNNLDITITKLLLANGANINDEPDLLNIAIKHKHIKMLEILWLFGADINAANYLGVTPLHYSIVDCQHFYQTDISKWKMEDLSKDDVINYPIVKFLLSKGAYVNAQTNDRKLTSLHVAVEKGYIKIVNILLEYNANVTLVNSDNYTPFHVAVMKQHTAVVDVFLKHGVDLNIKNNSDITLLHAACSAGNKIMVDKLLENNVSIDCVDIHQRTPLHFACETKKVGIIRSLLNHQADISTRDRYNQTPLHILSRKDLLLPMNSLDPNELAEICESFLELNADINAVDSEGRTPLFVACVFGNATVVRVLLKHKANMNCPDVYGETPIYIAAEKDLKGTGILRMLVENNADVDYVEKDGNTILHVAAMANNLSIIEVIDELNIDINVKNEKECTALHIATKKGSQLMVEGLIRHGADVNVTNTNDQTVLHCAISRFKSIQIEHIEYLCWPGHNYEIDDDDDGDGYLIANDTCKEIIKILQKHAIKLKMAQLYISVEISDLVYSDMNLDIDNDDMDLDINNYQKDKIDVSQFEEECSQELQKLKKMKFSSTTFYGLLTSDIHDVAKFANNQEIKQALQSDRYDQEFPLYIDIIRNRFKKGVARDKLLNIIKLFHFFIPSTFHSVPYNCVYEIFRYFNTNDLEIFIRVIRGSN